MVQVHPAVPAFPFAPHRAGTGAVKRRPMIRNAVIILTLVAAVGSGLVGGIWFTFSNFVMPALRRIESTPAMATMQTINVTVLNPGFFAVFFGTAIVSLALLVLSPWRWSEPGSGMIVVGAVLYLAGCIGVTILRNVPLNEALKVADPANADGAALWRRYQDEWTFWNTVRCIGTLAAAIMFTVALVMM